MHWTKKMFIEHGELFLKLINQRDSLTPKETGALEKIFSEAGVHAGDRVLDLCCGSGRHALNLAKNGFTVTGVDISPAAIQHAIELAEKMGLKNRTEFLVGDARKVSKLLVEKGSFEAIISMWTSIGYYDDATDRSIVRQLNKLASSEGILVLDVANRDYMIAHYQPSSTDVFDDYELHEKRKLDLEKSRVYDTWEFYQKDGEQLKHVVTIPIYSRAYSLHELVRLFEREGWNYCGSYGSFDLEPVAVDTPRIIIVGKKA
jgi:SAM-dependent methyltransferase